MGDAEELLSSGEADPPRVSILQVREVAARTLAPPPPSEAAFTLVTQLVKGHSVLEIPGRLSREGDNPPDIISLPEPRALTDYPLDHCKHECILIKQARHVRQAMEIF